MVVLSVATAARWAGGLAGAAVAAAASGIVGYYFLYPKRAKINGGRFPAAGRACVRWKGGPQAYIYYPATETNGGVEGLSRLAFDTFSGMIPLPKCLLWFLRKKTQISHRGVPVASSDEKFPVIFFSHGIFCGQEFFQTLCAAFAAAGYIVVAPEHEDQSQLSCLVEGTDKPLFIQPLPPEMAAIGPNEKLDAFKRDMVIEYRRPFLQKRTDELQFLLPIILQGSGASVSSSDIEQSLLEQILSRVDQDNAYIAGQSFGGATCLHLLHALGSKDVNQAGVQFRGSLLYDLWGKPLPYEVEAADTWKPCPQFVLLSEEWVDENKTMTTWAESVTFAKKMRSQAAAAGVSPAVVGPLLFKGSEHQSWIDVQYCGPLLYSSALPRGCKKNTPDVNFQTIVDASLAFMQLTRQSGKADAPRDFQALQDAMLADPLLVKYGF